MHVTDVSSGRLASGSEEGVGSDATSLKQLTIRRNGANKGSWLEYILVEIEEGATVRQLASLVKHHWLERTATGTPPAWLTALRSLAGNESWGVQI